MKRSAGLPRRVVFLAGNPASRSRKRNGDGLPEGLFRSTLRPRKRPLSGLTLSPTRRGWVLGEVLEHALAALEEGDAHRAFADAK